MPKLTPKRTFLLRGTGDKRVIAKKGAKIEVTDEEHRNFYNYFVEPPPRKKGALSVR